MVARPDIDDDEITSLALRARTGDRAAAAAFAQATRHDEYRLQAHLVAPGEADDLTQETFLRAMRSLPRFAGRSSARTWLLAIARRVAVDHFRGAASRPRTTSLETEVPGVSFEERVLLRQLLDGLDPGRREAFVATQVLGLSYAEAAEVCQCPVGTIRSRVARARDDLAAALAAGDGRERRGSSTA
jgi:RNA polymerase sigma-70 factor (ECF subfamily)